MSLSSRDFLFAGVQGGKQPPTGDPKNDTNEQSRDNGPAGN
jgi:hypothetical protein